MFVVKRDDYDPYDILLSVAISFLGAYATITLSDQLRNSLIEDKRIYGQDISISHKKKHLLYLFLMSLSLSGVATWSMHFLGMNACSLSDQNGERVHLEYNIPLTIASFLSAWVTSFVGFTIASHDPMFSKNKVDIVEEFIAHSRQLSFREIRKITWKHTLFTICTKKLGYLAVGGMIMSSGVCIMHYIGTIAIVFHGELRYYAGLVALSVWIAMTASCVAFWILFRLLSLFPEQEWLRLGSACLMALAVCGMHYTGMEATSYALYSDSEKTHLHSIASGVNVSHEAAYNAAVVGANVLLWLIVLFASWHSRCVNAKNMKIIRQADLVLQRLAAESALLSSPEKMSSGTVATTMSATSTLNATMVRTLTEQYLAKRIRNFESRLEVNSANRDLLTELQHQMQMGFGEYLVHLLLLVLTGQWQKAQLLIVGDGSATENGSLSGSDHDNVSTLDNNDHSCNTMEVNYTLDRRDSKNGLLSFRRSMENPSLAVVHRIVKVSPPVGKKVPIAPTDISSHDITTDADRHVLSPQYTCDDRDMQCSFVDEAVSVIDSRSISEEIETRTTTANIASPNVSLSHMV